MRNIFTTFLLILAGSLYLNSCGKPEDIISPAHYSRVPRAVNLSVSYDTSATGKYRVNINWSVANTNNLKDFEIYRSINNAGYFFLVGGITALNYIDSSLANTSDYSLAYFVDGRGIDRFVGQSSDTIKITVTKTF
jgi:hypothetical protein